ncbi:MAG: RidA family protein [bacterium]|nr:RidA family protein [bacterium]
MDSSLSKVVRAGNFVFLQGQSGLKLDGSSLTGPGDPAAQADQAMQNVKTLLEQAGARMEDICKLTTYVTRREHRASIYSVLGKHLQGVNPVTTGLVVNTLAKPELDFEIDVFAVIP